MQLPQHRADLQVMASGSACRVTSASWHSPTPTAAAATRAGRGQREGSMRPLRRSSAEIGAADTGDRQHVKPPATGT